VGADAVGVEAASPVSAVAVAVALVAAPGASVALAAGAPPSTDGSTAAPVARALAESSARARVANASVVKRPNAERRTVV
jgi:hypothetical protein